MYLLLKQKITGPLSVARIFRCVEFMNLNVNPESYYKCKKCKAPVPHHVSWCPKCKTYNRECKNTTIYVLVLFFVLLVVMYVKK